jgi:hypothetical protein
MLKLQSGFNVLPLVARKVGQSLTAKFIVPARAVRSLDGAPGIAPGSGPARADVRTLPPRAEGRLA